jgi:uncharacterized protein (TIGR00661 family)
MNSIPKIEGQQRILIAPLNWGLGHATRCIPIIHELISQGHYIIIASDGYPLELLKQEFPKVERIEFHSLSVRYTSGKNQVWRLLLSLPQILWDVRTEHFHLHHLINEHQITYVISDNRFGLWSKKVPCIYITHQLMIKMPRGFRVFEKLGWQIHRFFINRYTEVWIPDEAENGGLSGDLSHKYPLPAHARFIGCQSRFSCTPDIQLTETYHTVVVVSGPEPQRDIFEREWTNTLRGRREKVLVVRGIPKREVLRQQLDNVTLVSHLPSDELKAHLLAAKEIICRSGYSSIMDLHVLGKKATLIPTPGQTEQEYLADYSAGAFDCAQAPSSQ